MRRTGNLIPDFRFNTLGGGAWHSRDGGGATFRLLTIYRGMWCPHCKRQLQELNTLHDSFLGVGVRPIAVSADTRERAAGSQKDYALDKLLVGFEMPFDAARELGVFLSKGINDSEMPLFCEPASFLITADNRIQAAWIASNAFARTSMTEVRSYIDFLAEHAFRGPRGSA